MKTFTFRVLLAVLLLAGGSGRAATYYQSAPSYNSAFQALVNQAVSGDVIILRSGSHYVTEPIRLPAGKNGITIRGENGAVIRKAPHSYNAAAFEITGNNNTIDLLELDGGNLPEAGILIYGQRNTVSNCRIHNCGSAAAVGGGIVLHNSGNPVCAYNTVIGCAVYYNYMVGVSQNGHSDGTIRDNQIYENGAEGLTVDIRSHNNYIYNNWIHKNNTQNRGVGGVGIDFSNGNRLENNTIDYTVYRSGVTFQNNIGGCDGTILRNNRINNNEGYGILERWTQYRNTNTGFYNNELLNNRLGTQTIIYSGRPAPAAAPASPDDPELRLYPNPAREQLTLHFGATQAQRLTIRDMQGRLLYERAITNTEEPLVLPTSSLLANGAYLVSIQTPSTVLVRRLTVAH